MLNSAADYTANIWQLIQDGCSRSMDVVMNGNIHRHYAYALYLCGTYCICRTITWRRRHSPSCKTARRAPFIMLRLRAWLSKEKVIGLRKMALRQNQKVTDILLDALVGKLANSLSEVFKSSLVHCHNKNSHVLWLFCWYWKWCFTSSYI